MCFAQLQVLNDFTAKLTVNTLKKVATQFGLPLEPPICLGVMGFYDFNHFGIVPRAGIDFFEIAFGNIVF